MISNGKITEIFFQIDEFSKVFEPVLKTKSYCTG